MQAIAFQDFMSGEYKVKEKKRKEARKKQSKKVLEGAARLSAGISLPLLLPAVVGAPIGIGVILGATKVFASSSVPVAPIAVEVTAKEWMGEQTLSMLGHVLDPVVDVLVALSFPVASVVIVGACFFFIFGNAEKAWSMIQNAGLGYVLIQVSPLILNVLKQVGNAV